MKGRVNKFVGGLKSQRELPMFSYLMQWLMQLFSLVHDQLPCSFYMLEMHLFSSRKVVAIAGMLGERLPSS